MSPRLCTLGGVLLGLAACSVSPKSGNPNTSPTPDTHTYFPILTGPHAQDCNTCHGGFTSFKDFSCFGCHGHEVQAATDQLHLSVPAYKYDSPSCYQCHPTGGPVQPPFDHAGITGSCATCHAPGASFAALASQSDGSLVTVDGGFEPPARQRGLQQLPQHGELARHRRPGEPGGGSPRAT